MDMSLIYKFYCNDHTSDYKVQNPVMLKYSLIELIYLAGC